MEKPGKERVRAALESQRLMGCSTARKENRGDATVG